MGGEYLSRSNEYIKRYGKRYCYEWFMRANVDRCYQALLQCIRNVRTKARKDMAILVVASMAVNLLISCLLRKWK